MSQWILSLSILILLMGKRYELCQAIQMPLLILAFRSYQPISEGTPLLQTAAQPGYRGTHSHAQYDSTDTDSTDSDSDTPFFPPSKPRGTQHSYRHPHIPSAVPGFFQHIKAKLPALPQLTSSHKQVLKCSFAYFIGSLFTFIPYLNSLVGHNRRSSHIIATTTVFFNPAKTRGGMVEATGYGWAYVLFALTVSANWLCAMVNALLANAPRLTQICLGSMLTSDYYIDRDMETVAHVISLGFWLAGSAFVISFLKAYWNKPPVATGMCENAGDS